MKQFVIIARDGTDTEALQRRLQVRDKHLEGAAVLKTNGEFVFGGAMLNTDGQMCGSVMVVQFENDAAFEAWYQQEPYVRSGVWQHVEIMPFRVA